MSRVWPVNIFLRYNHSFAIQARFLHGATQGAEESNLMKITAKFPGKLRRRSSLLFQIQERDRAKRPRVLLRVC